MKIGGFGAIDTISRIGNSKPEVSKVLAVADSSNSASSVSSSGAKSRETTRSFHRELEKASEPTIQKKRAQANEDLAGAAGAGGPTNARADASADSNVESKSKSKVDSKSDNVVGLRAPSKNIPVNSRDSTPVVGAVPAEAIASPDTNQVIEAGSSAPVDERVNSIVESLEQTAETELTMRHLSMRDFLGKMKAEFGIEPQAVVKAFAGLDAAALMAPPDETADAVLSQLKLTPEQLPKAERFYREMLNQTGESALNETLVGVGAGISLKVLSEQDLAMEKLQSSISSLNNSFARRAEAAPPVTDVSAMGETLNPVPAKVAADTALDAAAADGSEAPRSDKESPSSKFAAIGAALSSAALNLSSQASPDASGKDSSSSSNGQTPEPRTEYSSIESALAASGFEVPPAGEKAAVPLTAGTSTAAALASAMLTNTETESSGNAQELVRHAQILMKNGGGEMKMQLKPEGVGEVTLKVAVKDGQVAIQMLTESDSAKKLLESNLDDLKTSLAQNKLHVDALKIEVGTEFAKQRFEQAQQDASREQARQMAQDFMGQFRQDREGFRQGFGESLGFKNYQQPKRNSLPELEPVVTASGSQQKSSERRLNLVA